jgi:hypothetical protein
VLSADDPARFYRDHEASLLSDEVQAAIAARRGKPSAMLAGGILMLGRVGEAELGFRLLDDPALRDDTLTDARRDGTARRLRALSMIALAQADTDTAAAAVLTHLAIAAAFDGDLDNASAARPGSAWPASGRWSDRVGSYRYAPAPARPLCLASYMLAFCRPTRWCCSGGSSLL